MTISSRLVAAIAAWVAFGASLSGQGRSVPAARDLAALLESRKLDSFAARMPGTDDHFVAALYVPGQQMIVVSGRYGSPSLIREKILLGRYKDAYRDLYGASDPSSRRVVEDLRADGLEPVPGESEPFDAYTGPTGALFRFDGDWKHRKVTEEAYMDTFRQAEGLYDEMAHVLLSALQKGGDAAVSLPAARAAVPQP